jgi:secondary thiamine-phosphate synthase enzyme
MVGQRRDAGATGRKHWAQRVPFDLHSLNNAMLEQHLSTLTVQSPGRGLVEITAEVRATLALSGIRDGLLTLFLRHTSASLVIQENADPDVRADLDRFFARLVRDGDALFQHRTEGPDDMPAHVRSALTATQLAIPIVDGRLALGTWQGIYLWEHRLHGHVRELAVHVIGEAGKSG